MYRPKSMYELQLLKQKLSSEIELKEELVIYEIAKMKDSFAEKVKLFAKFQTQKLAVTLISKLLRPRRQEKR